MARSRKFRWRLRGGISALLLTAVLGLGIYLWIRHVHGEPGDPLTGFTIMNLPRRDLDIGALWGDGIGPIQGSSGVPRLPTRSLQTGEISRVDKLHGSILANIARSLDLSANESAQASQTMKLKGLTIVTVADASKLKSVAGNHYIWEGVRADQFSMVASQAGKTGLEAKIKNKSDADNIDEHVTGSNSVELTAEGSKLYVAYRVVAISQPTLDWVDSAVVPTPSSDVNLGTEYALHFAPAHKSETMFTKDCAIIISVSSYLVLNNKSGPSPSNPLKIPCGGPYNQIFPLGVVSGSQRATIDRLQVKDLRVWPAENDTSQATGTFTIERRTMRLETLKDATAPGW